MRAEDHLGEDAEGDESEEASHGATEECSGRHQVPVKSHVTKCVHELKPSSTTFSVFFLAVAPYRTKSFHPVSQSALVQRRSLFEIQFAFTTRQNRFRVSGPARPFCGAFHRAT